MRRRKRNATAMMYAICPAMIIPYSTGFWYNIQCVVVCTKCKIDKFETDFSFRNKERGIRVRICKVCMRKMIKNHYQNNKQVYLDKTRRRNAQQRFKIRSYIWDYLAVHPCVDCGETDPIVLEFDHLRDKKVNVSHMVQIYSSLEDIDAEIAKCVVRCSNCHKRKTSRELGWFRK